MTNSELSDAIKATKAMLDATGHAQPDYPALQVHLQTLLAIQAARAGFVERGTAGAQ